MSENRKITVTLDVDMLMNLTFKSKFVQDVIPDYSYGRHYGFTDFETELFVDTWLSSVVNLLDELTIDIE